MSFDSYSRSSYLKGMHAFGLEECAQYDEAEKSAHEVCSSDSGLFKYPNLGVDDASI